MTTRQRRYDVIVKPTATSTFRALRALDPDAKFDFKYRNAKLAYYQIQTNAVLDPVLNNDEVIEYRRWVLDPDRGSYTERMENLSNG